MAGTGPNASDAGCTGDGGLKVLFSACLILFGLVYAWLYLRKPKPPADARGGPIRDDRPWRRVGAAICLLVSVMFVLGVYLVDIPDHPRTYAAFWAVLMGLVVWLCFLGLRDLRHTREIIRRRRAERRRVLNASSPISPTSAKDSSR